MVVVEDLILHCVLTLLLGAAAEETLGLSVAGRNNTL